MNVHERIKRRRKEMGLSADDVAKALNVSRATIYRYESSEIEKLPTSIIEPLCKVLKTTPAYLMGWDENILAEEKNTDYIRDELFEKRKLLFDISAKATEEDLDKIIKIVEALTE